MSRRFASMRMNYSTAIKCGQGFWIGSKASQRFLPSWMIHAWNHVFFGSIYAIDQLCICHWIGFFQLTICYRTFKLWLISPRFFSLSACTINKMGNRIWTSQGGRNLKFVLHSTNDSCLYIVLPIKKNQTMMLVTKKKD